MTSSLVEDMARAMAMSDTIESRHPSSMCPDYRNLAAVALSVLKDRLPADDRELVERARNEAQAIRDGLPQTADANLIDALADRIIVLSGLESGAIPALALRAEPVARLGAARIDQGERKK